jgi:uncharacterized damage-inducible protein DinB
MPDAIPAIRDHLVRLLDWDDAHVPFDRAISDIPPSQRGTHAPGFEHTLWQLLEHVRLAQLDILDFCVDAAYAHTKRWPDDYWPGDAGPPTPQAWSDSVAAYARDREALKALARETHDLTALVPTGEGAQTYLRAILLTADHTAYHVGQIVAVRRALGIWPGA